MAQALFWLLLAIILNGSFNPTLVPESPLACPTDVAQPYLTAEDDAPLGDRVPVILIHGWIAECGGPKQGWEFFLEYLQRRGLFKEFKFYRFIYPSRRLNLKDAGRALAAAIAARPELQGKQLILIGHSRGGLVARAYLELFGGHDHVFKLITLATPHHGTPLASLLALLDGDLGDATVRAGLKRMLHLGRYTDLLLIGAKLVIDLGYQLLFGIVPRSFHDMRWDDYDQITQRDYAHYPDRIKATLDNEFLRKLNEITEWDDRIIAYAGYLPPEPRWDRGLGWDGNLQRTAYRFSAALEGLLPGDFGWSDGLVPLRSATFAGHRVARRGPFPSMCHTDLRDNPEVLRQIVRDLQAIHAELQRVSLLRKATSSCAVVRGMVRLCAG